MYNRISFDPVKPLKDKYTCLSAIIMLVNYATVQYKGYDIHVPSKEIPHRTYVMMTKTAGNTRSVL